MRRFGCHVPIFDRRVPSAARGVTLLLPLLAAGAARGDEVDDFVRAELKRQRIPGAAIAVIQDGKIKKAKGYGVADLDHGVPATADTVFALASITKQFTATLIMMLVEEGKVALDDDIGKYLTDPPAAWKGITVRHLLNHTSGLSPLGKDFVSLVRTMTVSTEALYEAARKDPIGSKPGEKFSYSDVGYFLLGMIIEKSSGKTYDKFLSERILQPTGMSTARMLDLDRPYRNLAKGYTLVGDDGSLEVRNIRRDSQRELTPHYGLFGTVKDLAKWDAALSSNSLIKPASFQQMTVPQVLSDGTKVQYGFGWGIGTRNEIDYHFHSGITGTFIMRIPSLQTSVVVLTNLGQWTSGKSIGADAYMIAHGIASIVEPEFRLKPLEKQDSASIKKARETFELLMRGQLPESTFTEEAIRELSPIKSDIARWYGDLGDLRRVVMLDYASTEENPVVMFRFEFKGGSRIFAILYDKDGKVQGFFPDA